jgi:hypothetical protein
MVKVAEAAVMETAEAAVLKMEEVVQNKMEVMVLVVLVQPIKCKYNLKEDKVLQCYTIIHKQMGLDSLPGPCFI